MNKKAVWNSLEQLALKHITMDLFACDEFGVVCETVVVGTVLILS